jgi:putative transposase
MSISKSVYYYKSTKDDSLVIEKLTELSQKHSKRGCDKFYDIIRQEGLIWSYKRVRRVYISLKLNLKRKVKKRLPARVKQPIIIPESINCRWSMDFMSDALYSGRKIRILNI